MLKHRPRWLKRAALLVVLATTAAGCCCTAAAAPPAGPPPRPAELIVGDSNSNGNSWAQMMGAGCRPTVWAWDGVAVFVQTPFARSMIDLTDVIMARRPGAHVVIVLGTNDVLMSQPTPTVAQLVIATAGLIDAGATSVRWATIPPLGGDTTAPQRRRIDEWNRTILQTVGAVDLRNAFGSTLTPSALMGDGIHLSPTGHSALASVAARSQICRAKRT